MEIKSEILAFAFGVLLILVTFGDAHIVGNIGNLDTIFGLKLWPVLDIFYPIASIAVFLLYGWVKGNGLKFNSMTILLFISFTIMLVLINIDDFAQNPNVTLIPSKAYWTVIMWVYPVCSSVIFFLFGKKHETKKTQN